MAPRACATRVAPLGFLWNPFSFPFHPLPPPSVPLPLPDTLTTRLDADVPRGDHQGPDEHDGFARETDVARYQSASEVGGISEREVSFRRFQRPPSGSEDYTGEIKAALKQWDGTGGFVFTSSTAVYAGTDGETCDETTPEYAVGENPRADRLLQAEAAVLEAADAWCASRGCTTRRAARTCTS